MPDARVLEEFPPVSTDQWLDVVRKDLKGADFDKKLLWKTDEGITVKPFYRSDDVAGLKINDLLPGQFPYTRGTQASNDWKIRESIEEQDPVRANKLAIAALAAGADEIAFVHPDVHSAN